MEDLESKHIWWYKLSLKRRSSLFFISFQFSEVLNVWPGLVLGCKISVCSFWMKWSSLATWQAVKGLSPVIITTWKQKITIILRFRLFKQDMSIFKQLCISNSLAYTMRRFLDFFDNSLTVTFERTRNNHETSKVEIAFQSIPSDLPNLCDPKRFSLVSGTYFPKQLQCLAVLKTLNTNLLMT